ncbi:MAG: alcohol dehydrogenase [Metallosphaera yellowstonensis]|jgi:Alcohol dehydrogenase GroES-like domain.|uniref:Uncharacterized protein n=1 Tax=Metallosphaera yellowstonensis MK1 TaxID=671065 RepID=H2C8V0_9CREN|nr:alcohol dehydrogenase [Metallosphaera yellowstonensis]EHP68576.1 hypothetical protein MetMK1DRAFT_00030190 [Metallosphaera yellowstonensis MK1]
MKSIVFNQGIIQKDVPERPVEQDHVEVEAEKVLLNGIENAIYLGFLWVQPNLILGGTGTAKVTATALNVDPSLSGKRVLVLPFSPSRGGIGSEIDGILAERSIVPQDSIVQISEGLGDNVLLYPFISVALDIKDLISDGSTLIIGSGLTALITTALLEEVEVYVGEGDLKPAGARTIRSLDGKWDNVVITTLRGWARYVAEKIVNEKGKIVIPRFLKSWPPSFPRNTLFVEPRKRQDVLQYLNSQKVIEIMRTYVGFSEDVLASIPTPRPGVIVDIKKYFTTKK